MPKLLLFLCLLAFSSKSFADQEKVRVLCVVAHPDDEVAFAATVYKITHELNGTVDAVMITNGEGGYKYSLLAEPIYCLNLTDEEIGRNYLPFIRKVETLNAGKIMGMHNYYFFDQQDYGFTKNILEVYHGIWDIALIKELLAKRLESGQYDFVFTLLPHSETHGHHQAATVLALEAVSKMEASKRPIILAADTPKETPLASFSELNDFPITKTIQDTPLVSFNRLQSFGFLNRLNYQIIVNWVIAEHKSQGTVQLLMNKGKSEDFYYFALNGEDGLSKTKQLFEALNSPSEKTGKADHSR